MRLKKFNTNIIMTLVFLMFIFGMLITVIPFMFGDLDTNADANNISTSEYAEEYSSGQTTIEFILVILTGCEYILIAILFLYLITRITP